MVTYVVIGIVVGIITGTLSGIALVGDSYVRRVEFFDVLMGVLFGTLVAGLSGFLWPITVTIGLISGLVWFIYTKATKDKSSTYSSRPHTEKKKTNKPSWLKFLGLAKK